MSLQLKKCNLYSEKTLINLFNTKTELFAENTALAALFLQGLVYSKSRKMYLQEIRKLVHLITNQQNLHHGYFIEKHTNYHQPSALVSALAGIALIETLPYMNNTESEKAIKNINMIKSFLLNQEIKPGCFRKSFGFPFIILNANAAITFFFALLFNNLKNTQLRRKIDEFIESLPKYLLKDGALTYGISGERYFVPSFYYHSLTLLFLIRIQHIINSPKLERIIKISRLWMINSIGEKGIRWYRSGLPFSVYLSQAYAFSYYCIEEENSKWKEPMIRCLTNTYEKGLMFRLDRKDSIPQRLKTGISVGIQSSQSIRKKITMVLLICVYLIVAKTKINKSPRKMKKNPIFALFGIKSTVSPPIYNSYDYMTTIESYSYISLKLALENSNNVR